MASPAFRASQFTTWTSNPTTATIDRPASSQTGDLLIAHVALANSTGTVTTPTGWTKLYGPTVNAGFDVTAYVFFKVQAASEPSSYSWAVQALGSITISAFSNVDSFEQIDVSSEATPANGSSFTTTPVFTYQAGEYLLMLVAVKNFSPSPQFTSSASMTELYDDGSVNAERKFASGAATFFSGPYSYTATADYGADSGVVHLIALFGPSGDALGTVVTIPQRIVQVTGTLTTASYPHSETATVAVKTCTVSGSTVGGDDGHFAGTRYYFSPTGNDTTGNGSLANPWKTMAKAFDLWNNGALAYGDECHWVGSGVIQETVGSYIYVRKPGGSINNYVKFICDTPWGIEFRFDQAQVTYEKWLICASYCHFEGFWGNNTADHTTLYSRTNADRLFAPTPCPDWLLPRTPEGVNQPGGDHFRVINCKATGFNEPFKANRALGSYSYVGDPNATGQFKDCVADWTYWAGGLLGCESCSFLNFTSTNTLQDGVQFKANARNCWVADSTFCGDSSISGHGIMMGAASGATGGATPNDTGTWKTDGFPAYNCVALNCVVYNTNPFADYAGGPVGTSFYYGITINGGVDCAAINCVVINTKSGIGSADVRPYSVGWTSDLKAHNPTFLNIVFDNVDFLVADFDGSQTTGTITVDYLAYYNCDPTGRPNTESNRAQIHVPITHEQILTALPFTSEFSDWHSPSGSAVRGNGVTVADRGKYTWDATYGGQPVWPPTPNPTTPVPVNRDRANALRSGAWDISPYQAASGSAPAVGTVTTGSVAASGTTVLGTTGQGTPATGVVSPKTVALTGTTTSAATGHSATGAVSPAAVAATGTATAGIAGQAAVGAVTPGTVGAAGLTVLAPTAGSTAAVGAVLPKTVALTGTLTGGLFGTGQIGAVGGANVLVRGLPQAARYGSSATVLPGLVAVTGGSAQTDLPVSVVAAVGAGNVLLSGTDVEAHLPIRVGIRSTLRFVPSISGTLRIEGV